MSFTTGLKYKASLSAPNDSLSDSIELVVAIFAIAGPRQHGVAFLETTGFSRVVSIKIPTIHV